jgi:hypothetical protein
MVHEALPNGEGLFLMPHPLFHPVNPVNPVKIQVFNCIVPAKTNLVWPPPCRCRTKNFLESRYQGEVNGPRRGSGLNTRGLPMLILPRI